MGSKNKKPMEERHPDTECNPEGWEKVVERHRKKEEKGRYVLAACKTWIFVKDGEDAGKKIKMFNKKMKDRKVNGVGV